MKKVTNLNIHTLYYKNNTKIKELGNPFKQKTNYNV